LLCPFTENIISDTVSVSLWITIMKNKSVGLYIHIPFCRRKCLYCDFYSVALQDGMAEEYTAAVKRNIAAYGGVYDTVYFGGGTPILLAEYLGEMLSAADIVQGAEITAECNPCEMDERTLAVMRESGINRISVGVQSFNDGELTALGRRHDAKTAIRAIENARAAGFDNISLDLMLGIPQQTADSLGETLRIAIELPVTHISAYMLKVEENTPFGRNTPSLPDEDETADMYLQTVDTLNRAGLMQYEISNFAKRGCESRHNLKYWHRLAPQTAHFPDGQCGRLAPQAAHFPDGQCDRLAPQTAHFPDGQCDRLASQAAYFPDGQCDSEEYIGIGPAAHSFYGGRRFAVARDLDDFLHSPVQRELTTDEAPDEYSERVMLGLRLTEGIPEELWKPLEAALKRVPKNYYRIENGRLSLTAEGFLLSNEIIALLLAEM